MTNTKLTTRQVEALTFYHTSAGNSAILGVTVSSLRLRGLITDEYGDIELTQAGRDAIHVCIDCDTIINNTDTDAMYDKLGKICNSCYNTERKAYEAEKYGDSHELVEDIITDLHSTNPWNTTLPCLDCFSVVPVLQNGTFLQHTRGATDNEIVRRGMRRVHCAGSGKVAPTTVAQYA